MAKVPSSCICSMDTCGKPQAARQCTHGSCAALPVLDRIRKVRPYVKLFDDSSSRSVVVFTIRNPNCSYFNLSSLLRPLTPQVPL